MLQGIFLHERYILLKFKSRNLVGLQFSILIEFQTMGMAGMLDEIINYVQSLQNQVEVSLIYIISKKKSLF